jgi:hypothetical protein
MGGETAGGQGVASDTSEINSPRFDGPACEMTVAQIHGALLEGGSAEAKRSGVPQVQGRRLLKERTRGSE